MATILYGAAIWLLVGTVLAACREFTIKHHDTRRRLSRGETWALMVAFWPVILFISVLVLLWWLQERIGDLLMDMFGGDGR
ncbi:MAG TPA: hypothetical protein VKA19_06890 [Alphaproteobacteria bacterium]|nr:hypothetical protein [Alphaproteobacteria bacterium]